MISNQNWSVSWKTVLDRNRDFHRNAQLWPKNGILLGALIMTWFWPFLYLLGRKLNCHNIFSNNIGQMFRWNCIGGSNSLLQRYICVLIIDRSWQKPGIFEKMGNLGLSYDLIYLIVTWGDVIIGKGIITLGSRGWNSIRFMLVLIILSFEN